MRRRNKRVSPLAELAERLSVKFRNEEYAPTKEELEAVSKCKNEVLASSLKYPLFFGVIAGSVSYRLQVLTRAFSIAVASAFGLEYGRRKAEYACIKHFISLDGSPIKSILVDILQRDFPDHPLLREASQSNSFHSEGYKASENNLSRRKEIGFPAEPRGFSSLGDSPPDYGMEGQERQFGELGGKPRNMISRRDTRIGRRQAAEGSDLDNSQAIEETDLLVDPFSIAVWSEIDDNSGVNSGDKSTRKREVRLSRMTSEQKKEHYKRLRELRDSAQRGQFSSL